MEAVENVARFNWNTFVDDFMKKNRTVANEKEKTVYRGNYDSNCKWKVWFMNLESP